MDGLQLLNYIGFVISIIVNLCDIKDGRPPSHHWIAASGILGILAIPDFYFNRLQGLILPVSLLDPDYQVNKIKNLLNPKLPNPYGNNTYCNGREIQPSHFTKLDYLSIKLNLNSSDRITRHFALFPMKADTGFIWLKFYYALSAQVYGPGLHDGTSYVTKGRTSDISRLGAIIENYKANRPVHARKR